MSDPVLYVISCGAPPARQVDHLAQAAHSRGWDVCVITTPSGRSFVDVPRLEQLTGHPVRSAYKHPDEPDVLPPPEAIIVAPATVNTINKWAAGICDTLALGLVVEAIGLDLPVVAVPYTNRAHAAHPMFDENIKRLRAWGITILYGQDIFPLHEPRAGGHLDQFPWTQALHEVETTTRQ